MKNGRKTALIILAAAVVAVLAASLILRAVLTRDRLISLIVPKMEKAVDARITIGDMGIRFPFGFGVNVKDISFVKSMPDSTVIDFRAGEAQVRVSLMSLIRKRPEIGRLDVNNSTVTFTFRAKGMEAVLSDVRASMKMRPEAAFNLIEADADIGSALVRKGDGPGGLTVGKIHAAASLKSGIDFADIEILDSRLQVAEIVEMDIKGRMEDLKGARNYSFSAVVPETQLPGVVDWLKKLDFASLMPAPPGEGAGKGPGPEVTAGTFDMKMEARGSFLKPAEALLSGTLHLGGATVKLAGIDMPAIAGGNVVFSRGGAKSDDLDIKFGRSAAKAVIDIALDENNRPSRIGATCDLSADVGELAGLFGPKEVSAAGALKGRITVAGTPATLASLFPGKDGRLTREAMETAWRDVELSGNFSLENVSFRAEGNPIAVTGLKAGAKLSGGSLAGIDAKFNLGSSPWSATGSFDRILPCMSELMIAAAGAKPGAKPAEIIDSVRNLPDAAVEIRGRSFDARPFERMAAAKKAAASPGAAANAGGAQKDRENDSAAGAVLILMNTSFRAAVDSIITEKALFTSIEAGGTIVRGRLDAPRVTLDYAGGRGTGSAAVDLRDPDRIASKFAVDFREVSASKAVGGLHRMGSLLSGTFSFKSSGEVESGPGLDPLQYLTASGDAISNDGAIDLSPFLSSISSLGIVDLSGMQKLDFSQWTGNYSIENGRLTTDDWKIRSSGGDFAISGSFGFDGSLDYRAHIVIPPQAQQKMKDLEKFGEMVDLFRDGKGNLVLDLDVGGTAKSPKVALDQTSAKEKAGRKLIDGVKKGAADKLKDLLEKKK
ncbi:MAG: AsmA-like C-terminal region-containing protein [Candidatus Krumholzibacteria bacterium]|jgi:hypothetical protein|nr:AsmA-like C-terminal region-containing protein [Candidatus Krumholzibacteria bacterium]